MGKDELALMIHEKYGVNKSMSRRIVDDIFDEISDSLKNDEPVSIFGFGKFDTRIRKARDGFSHFSDEKTISIKEKRLPTFHPFKNLKETLNKED